MFASTLLTTEDRILFNVSENNQFEINDLPSKDTKDEFHHLKEIQPSLMLAEDVFLMELLQQELKKKAQG